MPVLSSNVLLAASLVIAFLFITSAEADNCKAFFQPCSDTTYGKLSSLKVNGTCLPKQVQLKKGTVVEVDFTFTSANVEANLTSVVKGCINRFVCVDFALKNPNACKDSGITCPIKANVPVTLSSQLAISSEYPAIPVIVKWMLQNKNGNNIFCAVVPAHVVN